MMYSKEDVKTADRVLDQLNVDFGDKESYCIACKSSEYSGDGGIVHTKQCPITILREVLKKW